MVQLYIFIGIAASLLLNMIVFFVFALHHNMKNYNTHSSDIDDELKAAEAQGREPESVVSDSLNNKINNFNNN